MRQSFFWAVIVCGLGWGISASPVLSAEIQAAPDAAAAGPTAAAEPAKGETAKPEDPKPESPTADRPKNDKSKTGADAKKKVHALASFTLDGSLPEGAGAAGLFGDLTPNLHKVQERITRAAKDGKVGGILLRIENPGLGRGKVEEMRSTIAEARKQGKKVYAYVQDVSNTDYLLAVACDQIIIPPSGTVSVTGVRAEITFYKTLLDRLGVKADMMQVGDFKGAAEPYTRESMSPEFKRQFESLIDDFYEQMVGTIAQDRKLDRGKVKDLLDEGLFTAAEAKSAGLVDRVEYEDEFRARLQQETQSDEVAEQRNYGKKEIDADFSGFGGMMKFMELLTGAEPGKKSSKGKKIAIVYAVGTIMSGESTSGMFAETLGGNTLVKALREAEKDDKVAAIVLRVDSPGGSALASDLVWREVVRSKKPIVASMGDVAASGGYYISMGADKIFAEPGTLTGSIGVVGGKIALKGLFDKVGVKTEVISRGKNSGWESSDEPFTQSERDAWMKVMREIYSQFTTKAAEGRKLELPRLQELAQGKVYTGRQALENRLVDQLGTLDDAVAEAKKLAGVPADEAVERLILPEPRSIFEELFGGAAIEMRATVFGGSMNGGVSGQAVAGLVRALEETDQMLRLFRDPAVTVMPFRVRIR